MRNNKGLKDKCIESGSILITKINAMKPLKQGKKFQQMKVQNNMNSAELGLYLGFSESFVNARIQLLSADNFLIDALDSKLISINAVLILKGVDRLQSRKALMRKLIGKKIDDVELRKAVKELNAK